MQKLDNDHQPGYLSSDASLYVWLGADQNEGLPTFLDFMLMMSALPEFAYSLLYHNAKSTRIRNSKELDGRKARVPFLRQRQRAVYSADAPNITKI